MTRFDHDNIEMFSRTICGQHIRMTFLERVQKSVCYVAAHPEYIGQVGAIESTTGGVLVNHKVFSAFLGLKSNSLARNFRDHHFVLDQNYDPSRELLARLPTGAPIDTRKWALRRQTIGTLLRDTPLHGLAPGMDDAIDDAVYDGSYLGDETMNDPLGLLVTE
jgi:hypothetical protein